MYLDLVLAKDDKGAMRLYRAPGFSNVNVGTLVACDGDDAGKYRTVIATLSIPDGGEELDFIRLLNHGEPIRKVIYKLILDKLEVEDEQR